MNPYPFHLAFPVTNLEKAEQFYGHILGCPRGRASDTWIDFNFFGNQITAHLGGEDHHSFSNPVDRLQVPVPHFGAIVPWEHFHQLAERLHAEEVSFVHEPSIRFEGLPGEQATMFVNDGNGNVLEFKSFKDPGKVFAIQ